MSSMTLHGIQVVNDNVYAVTFVTPEGTRQQFEFVVSDDLGIPSVQWPADFERALGMRLSLARPIVDVVLTLHSARALAIDLA